MGGFRGRVCCVASSNKSGFAAEVHLEIKNQVKIYVFISYRVLFTVIQDMESNINIGHFFLDRVTPKSVVIFLIEFLRFSDWGRYLHTKLVGLLEETCFDLRNYVISILQSIRYPTSKGGFLRNSIPYNIFCNIYRVWFLEILQWAHIVLPSFHKQRKSHTLVVFLRLLLPVLETTNLSSICTAISDFYGQWFTLG